MSLCRRLSSPSRSLHTNSNYSKAEILKRWGWVGSLSLNGILCVKIATTDCIKLNRYVKAGAGVPLIPSKFQCKCIFLLAYLNGFINTWIVYQIFMYSNKVKLVAGKIIPHSHP